MSEQPLFEIRSRWRVWGLWTWFLGFLHGCFAVFRCCAFLPLLSQSHDMVLLFLFRFDFSCLFGLVLCSAIFCSFLFCLLCLVMLFAESAFLRFPAFLQQSKQHNNQSSKLHKARARPLRSKELETKNLIILTRLQSCVASWIGRILCMDCVWFKTENLLTDNNMVTWYVQTRYNKIQVQLGGGVQV